MTDSLTIAIAQLNPVVGDIEGNVAKIKTARDKAPDADLIVFSELFVTGYPPEDLVLKPAFQDEAMAAVQSLAELTADKGPALLIGTPWRQDGALFNAVALLSGGKIEALRFKHHLPNYGVFDEVRVFEAGPMPGPVNFKGVRLGIPICEDIWFEDVCECLQETGAEILVVPNGSPFNTSKLDKRINHVVARVTECGLPLIYANQLGGQDELVFDGASFVLNADRTLALQLPAWEEALAETQWARNGEAWRCQEGDKVRLEDGLESVYLAMVLGLRDYVEKNRFPGVVLGLSGGIDSALCAAVAVDALGPDRVHCVMMPSRYTSQESLDDAADCAKRLGVSYETISIAEAVETFDGMLAPVFGNLASDTTEENIQSRIRAVILMALSNKFGHMLVTTGNKSEMSVGYATLYGDMCGGYNPLKDVYKTDVFGLSRWRNDHLPKGAHGPEGAVIPVNIIDKPPTAELRPDQKDEDSLPPYDVLDDILESLVENELSIEEIVARGHDLTVVKRIEHLLYIAEYKRRQSPPGVKVGIKNFGRDRRYPITNGFRDAR